MTTSPRPTTPLRQRMIEDMKIRNLSPHTIQAYVDRVVAFAKHFGKSPQLLGPKEVRTYLVFLVDEKRVSRSYYGQEICALRFLYRVTLGKDWVVKGVVSPKKEMKLPVILSAAEVTQFLGAITSLKHRAILMTAYGAGLRVSEVVALQVADIDSRRMVIRIRQGKGHKDREVMLSHRLLAVLREYWKAVKPKHWLFPGQIPDRPLTAKPVWHACVQAGRNAGLDTHVTVHTLSHACAIHLLEEGLSLKEIVDRLGHRHPDTTRIYAKVNLAALRQVAEFDLGGLR
jgi:integrase/recombinase XerD